MNKIWLIFLVVFAFSQIQTNGSISVRTGDGYNYINNDTTDYDYFESIGDLNFYRGNFRGWLQYEWSDLPETGLAMNKIRKRALTYENEHLFLELGDFYPLIGRGLVLNAFDDQGQDWDSGLDGFHFSVVQDSVGEFGAIAGTSDFFFYSPAGSLREPEKIEKYFLRGGYLNSNLFEQIDFGLHWFQTTTESEMISWDEEWLENHLYGGYFSASFWNFDLFYESAIKQADKITKNIDNKITKESSPGYGIYANLAGYFDLFSFSAEYKNYQFDVEDPGLGGRLNSGRITRVLPFQNPPTCVKELGSQLLSRVTHQVDFNDEVGGQIQISAALPGDVNWILSAASASRTAKWEKAESFEYKEIGTRQFVPSFENQFDPYWEMVSEFTGYLDEIQYSAIAAWNSQITAVYDEIEKASYLTIPVNSTIPFEFGNVYCSVEYQNAWKENYPEYSAEKVSFYNVATNFSVYLKPAISLGFSHEISNEPLEISEKHWIQGDFSMRLKDSYLMQISYGSERGGIKCSNGVCRVYPQFNGLRITFSGQF